MRAVGRRIEAAEADRLNDWIRAATARARSSAHPPLVGILAAPVKTGTHCRYEPDPRRPIRWTL